MDAGSNGMCEWASWAGRIRDPGTTTTVMSSRKSTLDLSREVQLDDSGQAVPGTESSVEQYTRTEYVYDAHGNWTECIRWVKVMPNPDFERSKMERREIEYYA